MTTRYADGLTTTADPTVLAQGIGSRQPGRMEAGRLYVAEAVYTLRGTELAADKVRLFKLKEGDCIIPQLSYIYTEVDPGGTLTVDIGDEDSQAPTPLVDSDADRYADGVDCAAAGSDAFSGGVAADTPYRLNEDAWITMTFATVSSLVEGGKLRVMAVYRGP